MQEQRACFIIAPIGSDNSEVRKRSDMILREIIEPVVSELGYNVVRADQIAKPGVITVQIIQYLYDSPLVIADLTGYNANVFYELGVRHAAQRPVIQMIEKGQNIPFDTAANRTIFFDSENTDGIERCRAELETQVRSISEDPEDFYNPVALAVGAPRSNEIARFSRLLDNPSRWSKEYIDNRQVWVSKDDSLYQIEVGERFGDFTERWTQVYPDTYGSSKYPVYLRINGVKIKELTFISCDGGRIFVPLPEVKAVGHEQVEYHWERNSLGMKVCGLIGEFHIYENIDGIARMSNVQITE